ncbi:MULTISPECIES: hypothetical protein [unclassified Streptomyces]|uniref:hypothetical protein n=1 Tax=unclassified Streptomyces TaxID=2593676 RepID=UPI00352FBDFC
MGRAGRRRSARRGCARRATADSPGSAPSRFSAAFTATAREEEPPTHLYFHVARILQGTVGIPETGGIYRVAIDDVSAWTMGDSDH